jgi:hypothetical protein
MVLGIGVIFRPPTLSKTKNEKEEEYYIRGK